MLLIRYIARRAATTVVVIWLVASTIFLMLYLLPGDPALMILGGGDNYQPSPEQIAQVREELGLDRPVLAQYGSYLSDLVHGDLGNSLVTGRPVWSDVGTRFGRTLVLIVPALVLATAGGIVLGAVAATHRNSWKDLVASGVSLAGFSVPIFVTGALSVWLFSITLGWLPASGYVEVTHDPLGSLRYMLLPVLVLAITPLAVVMRMTRTAMLEELSREYIRTAVSKGLTGRWVLYRHVVRNAALPIVSSASLQIGTMLSGAVLIEAVFAWPGINSLLLQAIGARDYPVIRAIVLVTALLFVSINFLTDLLYAAINPRIRSRA